MSSSECAPVASSASADGVVVLAEPLVEHGRDVLERGRPRPRPARRARFRRREWPRYRSDRRRTAGGCRRRADTGNTSGLAQEAARKLRGQGVAASSCGRLEPRQRDRMPRPRRRIRRPTDRSLPTGRAAVLSPLRRPDGARVSTVSLPALKCLLLKYSTNSSIIFVVMDIISSVAGPCFQCIDDSFPS